MLGAWPIYYVYKNCNRGSDQVDIIVVVDIKLKHLKSPDCSKFRNKIKLFRECLHKIKLNVVRVVKLKNVSRSAQCGVMAIIAL